VRHSVVVRVTHWLTTFSFCALLISGIAILLAHPRLYWGETGTLGTPSLVDLPLPFVLTGQTGWGRYLHFLGAWICVLTAAVYGIDSLRTKHFRKHLLAASIYNAWQRVAYLLVVFVLFPLMIWTGLAMSPALTSAFPLLVTSFGGQQSARTIHFLVATLVVAFLVGHVAMVCLTGFAARMRAMTIGGGLDGEEPA
jgi:thiosulfate reductase cytochrome b subunit